MIVDKTIDQALIEIMRCKKALEALRAARKAADIRWLPKDQHKQHAAAKRASLDLTRVLADLRQGR